MLNELTAISPLDGRYRDKVASLSDFFSEQALMKYRLHVEVEWLIFLCNQVKLPETTLLTKQESSFLRSLVSGFNTTEAQKIKDTEKVTNHDVKAIEYYLKEKITSSKKLSTLSEFIHFGCTSEDINNTAYNLMMKDGLQKVLMPQISSLIDALFTYAQATAEIPMLARTHGQPASPTTVGKEFINFVARLDTQLKVLASIPFKSKWSGAVGNFNAHLSAYPKLSWEKISAQFVTSLGLCPNLYTTQIESHDAVVAQCDTIARLNTILIGFSRDIWMYISYGFFKQKTKAGEIGSSTMPHKVNPIDFENAEGNLGLANSLLRHFSEKLPISRMQRDLTDSTVLRNLGVAMGYSFLAYTSLAKGMGKLEINEARLAQDLEENVEVLAEPIQTVLRKHKVAGAYEQLKELTRGKKLTLDAVHAFIKQLKIPDVDKKYLLALTPAKYTGLAAKLVRAYKR